MSDGSVREKDPNDLELPLGKRTKLYRFFEILPGFLSYSMIILLVVLSWLSPTLGSVYLLIIITATLVKAIGIAMRTLQGYNGLQRAMKVDWHKRLEELGEAHKKYEELREMKSEEFGFSEHVDNLRRVSANEENYPKAEEIVHAVIMTAYNEGIETMRPSIEAVVNQTFPSSRVIFVLAYEERGGEEIEQRAKQLKKEFEQKFYSFLLVKHPDGLKREIKGKGPNLTYAGKELAIFVQKRRIREERVIVTSLDADNQMSPSYLDYVAYEFIVHENRERLSYQPVAVFTNNIWDAPAVMRVIAMSNSFFNVINTMRPHLIRNFASHSQPLSALIGMDFWSKKTIVEDGHQYWRSLFYFRGDYDVISIRVPIYQDAVIGENLWDGLKAQFVQLRRWDYGASDVAYVGVRLVNKQRRKMPFMKLWTRFWRLVDSHVTLAAMSPIVAFGGWVPMLMNNASRTVVVYNLPRTVSIIQTFATVGLFVTILLSLRMLPPRPKKYKKSRSVMMVVQWVLSPVIAVIYNSLAAFYAQTRLMLGLYMEKFDVTKKVVKK